MSHKTNILKWKPYECPKGSLNRGRFRAFHFRIAQNAFDILQDKNCTMDDYARAEDLTIEKVIFQASKCKSLPSTVTKTVPKGMVATVSKTPPVPDVETVIAHLSLIVPMYPLGALVENPTRLEMIAFTHLRLVVRRHNMPREMAIHRLNSYFSRLFGTNVDLASKTKDRVKKSAPETAFVSVRDALWGDAFNYYSNCPVTVYEDGVGKIDKKVVRVAHQAVPHTSNANTYYVYQMNNKQECAYAVLCTMINRIFFFEWADVLKEDVVPRPYQQAMVRLYHLAIVKSSSVRPYFDVVYNWIAPALSASLDRYVDISEECAEAVDDGGFYGAASLSAEVSVISMRQRERLFAYAIVRDILDSADPLHAELAPKMPTPFPSNTRASSNRSDAASERGPRNAWKFTWRWLVGIGVVI